MKSRKNPRLNIIRIYFSFAIIFILGGCAGDVNMLPTLSQKSVPKTNQGVVVVRVINASAYPLPFNQLTITPENLNESKKIKPSRLQALTISTTRNTVFSSPVKSGSYSLDSIRAFHTRGDYWYSRWVGSDAQFGTFSVKPGKVTDLGTIIYYPKPQEDKYLNTLLRQPSSQVANTLNDYFPFYKFSTEQVLTWSEDEYQEERDALFVSVAQNPVTFNTQYLAPDNSIYFIGKLGVILKRTAEKEWETDAVDTNFDLFAITQNKHGDIMVGGDEGVIFFKSLNGEWQNISIENSHHIEELHFSQHGYIELISRKETSLHVMTKPLTNLYEKWKTIVTYDSINGWKGNHENQQKNLVNKLSEKNKTKPTKKNANRIVSAVTNREDDIKTITLKQQSKRDNFVFSAGTNSMYQFNPENWNITEFVNDTDFELDKKIKGGAVKINTSDSDFKLDKKINGGAVKIGIEYAGFWSFNGKPQYYKQDLTSKKWTKIATSIKSCEEGYRHSAKFCVSISKVNIKTRVNSQVFNFTSIPWFANNNQGVAIVSFSGKKKSESAIINTVDGGKTWHHTEYKLPNEFCTQLVNDIKTSLLLSCEGVSSDFYESIDNGKTWTQVREHENF